LRVHLTVCTAALLAVASAVQGAPAQTTDDLPTVAVMDFTGFMLGEAGNSVNLGKAFSTMLVTEFSGRPGMRVVERQQLNDLLTEQKLALSGRVDESTAVEVGKLLGAQYVFLGSVTSMGEQLRVDIHVTDVETSKILLAMKRSDKTTNLLDVVVKVADDFSSKLDLTPPSERAQVEPIPVKATIEFSRAVDFEDKGDTAQAVEHYKKALEIYPNHRDAKQALARLQGGGE
jgi:TolB-like protein